MNRALRIGTRDSALALWQANTLQERLLELGISAELVPIKSQGDLNLEQPLYAMGITGIFTKTLDIALLNKDIDLAIHSMKDVPTKLPKGIVQAAVLERGPVRDIIVWKNAMAKAKEAKTIATGSLRRKAQWGKQNPQDKIVPLRGNIQTRLKKLQEEDWDGAIFAEAALHRLEIKEEIIEPLDQLLPAPAQGALMVVCRIEDESIAQQLTLLNHREAEICTQIERDFLSTLEGGCTAPIGAYAHCENDTMHFSGGLYSLKGSPSQEIKKSFPKKDAYEMGAILAQELLQQGGDTLMKEFKKDMPNFRLLSTKCLTIEQQNRLIQTGVNYSCWDFIKSTPTDFKANPEKKSLIFSSQNAVKSVFNQFRLSGNNCYCVGEKTKKLLEENGQKVVKMAQNASVLADFIRKMQKKSLFCFLLEIKECP